MGNSNSKSSTFKRDYNEYDGLEIEGFEDQSLRDHYTNGILRKTLNKERVFDVNFQFKTKVSLLDNFPRNELENEGKVSSSSVAEGGNKLTDRTDLALSITRTLLFLKDKYSEGINSCKKVIYEKDDITEDKRDSNSLYESHLNVNKIIKNLRTGGGERKSDFCDNIELAPQSQKAALAAVQEMSFEFSRYSKSISAIDINTLSVSKRFSSINAAAEDAKLDDIMENLNKRIPVDGILYVNDYEEESFLKVMWRAALRCSESNFACNIKLQIVI